MVDCILASCNASLLRYYHTRTTLTMALYKRIPTQIVIAAYHKEDGAEKARANLVEAMADEQIVCTNVAIAKKNDKGKVHCKELGKPGFVKGLIGGGVAGNAAGAAIGGAALHLLGPIGVGAGAIAGGLVGGAIGSVKGAVLGSAGKITTEGMDKGSLKSLKSALIPSTSALVAIFGEVTVSKRKLKKEGLKERKEGVDEIVAMMASDMTEKLKNENDCAYHLAFMADGVIMTQVTVACFATDFKQMIITPNAATARRVSFAPDVAADESVTVGEGVAGAAAVITPETVEYEAEYEA